MKYISKYQSKIGSITLASDGEYLTGLWFDGQKYDRSGLSKDFVEKDLEIFQTTKDYLDKYFRGERPNFLPATKIKASDFRMMVFDILKEIPYGESKSYSDIAKEIAKRKKLDKFSARPVANAIGHNPISIIIPCHRVVGKDNSIRGYAGGVDKKIKLLELEKIDISKIKIK